MKTFLVFIGLFLAGFVVMGLLSWPLYEALTPTFDVKFHRVANRLGMLALLIGFILVARRLQLADRKSLGYGVPRAQFWREVSIGLGLGVLTMAPVALIMVGLDLRSLREGFSFDAGQWAALAIGGLASGITVSFIEETFLRGAMHSGIARESGARAAVLLTALLYASLHFFGRYRVPVEELGPDAGWRYVGGTLAAFGSPGGIIDAFLALFAVGVLLGIVRQLTGHIGACIGLHAGWVWVIAFLRETSLPDESHPARWLLSSHDGVVGWLVLCWTLIISVVIVRIYMTRAAR